MRVLFYILTAAALLFSAFEVYDLYEFTDSTKAQHITHGNEASQRVAQQMDSILYAVMNETQLLADHLSAGKLQSGQELKARLKSISEKDPNIHGMTAAFEPYQFSVEKALYAPFFDKDKNEFIYCEDFYDYTDPTLETSQWYTKVRNNGKQWIEPYFAEAAKTMVADYGVPFYNTDPETGEQKVAGTITGTISLNGLTTLLNSLSLGQTGYAFAIHNNGTFLSHPNREYPKAKKTIFSLAREQNDRDLSDIADKMNRAEQGFASYFNQVTGQDSWLFYSPIKATGWSVGVVMIKDELLADKTEVNRKKMHIALSAGLFILCLTVLLSGAMKGTDRGLWWASAIASVLILAMIGYTWYLEINSNRRLQDDETVVIADYAGLNSFLSSSDRRAESLNNEKPHYIPTGVFIEEVEFTDSYNVNVSGYIWQKYNDQLPDGVKEGVVLPEVAPDAEAFTMNESYREKYPHHEVVGWEFRSTLRLNFDYRVYPFDRREISLKARQKDFTHNVVLTPDFDAYKTLTPSSLPGTKAELVVPGWETEASYFDYKFNSYNANFGINDFYGQENVPEFRYNILLKRHILSPFISTIIPLLVVAIMLFGVVISTTRSKTKNTLAGFSAFGVVQACAAFFFVIILGHIDMRTGMNTEEITYIEYFYFIMYLMLLLVAFNVVMFSRKETRILHYKDNLVMKLAYWPMLLSICLVVTLVMFY